MNSHNISLPTDAITALERGNKLEAIKIAREDAWMTLKQARTATEAYLEANPSLKAKYEQNSRSGNRVLFAVAVVAIGVVAFTLLA